MSIKLIKSEDNLEIAKKTFLSSFNKDNNNKECWSCLILQSINGYYLPQVPKKEKDLNEFLGMIKKEYQCRKKKLFWNDLLEIEKGMNMNKINKMYLVSISTLIENKQQSINWFSLNSLKKMKQRETLTIALSSSLVQIIDL
mgnify:CR=1 FL=1